jgi:hypothetical protein
MRKVAPRAFSTALWPDRWLVGMGHFSHWPQGPCVPIDDWLGWVTFRTGPKGLVSRLMIGWDGSLFAQAPRAFSTALWPDRWLVGMGHFSHWPQGPFLWPCGPILYSPLGGQYPSQSGHKAVEKSLGASAKSDPSQPIINRDTRPLRKVP